MTPPRLPLLAAIAALAAGCAAQGPFPSLAPRAVEYEFSGEPLPPCLAGADPTRAAPAPPAAVELARDAALPARIARLKAQAAEGDRAFEAALDAAGAAVAAAGAAGSDGWIEAHLAISRAETARAPTTDALADLTALALEESLRPAHPLDRQAAEAAVAEMRALADSQAARIEALKASLSDL